MPPPPDPPSVVWLWPGQALYVGRGLDSTPHRHHAVQVGVTLEGSMRVGLGSDASSAEPCAAFAVGSDTPHLVLSEGSRMMLAWSERSGIGTANLGLKTWASPDLSRPLQSLVAALPATLDCPGAHRLALDLLRHLAAEESTLRLDSRVEAVAQIARSQVLSPRPIADLARQVGLSPSRLRHLFRQQMGLSLQRYLLWQRLFRALEYASGQTLTEAAHAAGFADSAHLARVFRETFGFRPSEVFGGSSHSVQVNLCRHP